MEYLKQISEKLPMSPLHVYIYSNLGSLFERIYI